MCALESRDRKMDWTARPGHAGSSGSPARASTEALRLTDLPVSVPVSVSVRLRRSSGAAQSSDRRVECGVVGWR